MDPRRSSIVRTFKLNGYTLRSDAATYLVEILDGVEQENEQITLDKLVDVIQHQNLNSSVIEKSSIERAVCEVNSQILGQTDSLLCVIDAFSVPNFVFNGERKKLVRKENQSLLSSPRDRGEVFHQRLGLVRQRFLRNSIFLSQPGRYQITPIEQVLGSGQLERVIVLGILIQLAPGRFAIEDETGTIPMNLQNTEFNSGLFTETSIVIAEGPFEDNQLRVRNMGFPPAEPSAQSRSHFGSSNFFGGPHSHSVKISKKFLEMEQENPDSMMIFASDVWLDDARVLAKLRLMFSGYSEFPPAAFIFCGSFLSPSVSGMEAQALKKALKNLATLILEYPTVAQASHFVFVPSMRDVGVRSMYPRPAIPDAITKQFRQKVKNAIFTSNPTRMTYCTKEIVVFREDLTEKLCRNALRFPSEKETLATHLSKTLLGQGHLLPLPPYVAPVCHLHDASLRLYPLPDLVLLADRFPSFTVADSGCILTNPGSFPRSNFEFQVFLAHRNTVEDSALGDTS